jgi:TIR domain
MATVFVSYRSTDQAWASAIRDLLSDAHHVFFDQDFLLPGQQFDDQLFDTLDGCDVVIAVVSPEWQEERLQNRQDYVLREIGRTLRAGKPLIPVYVGGRRPISRQEASERLPRALTRLGRLEGVAVLTIDDLSAVSAALSKAVSETLQWRPDIVLLAEWTHSIMSEHEWITSRDPLANNPLRERDPAWHAAPGELRRPLHSGTDLLLTLANLGPQKASELRVTVSGNSGTHAFAMPRFGEPTGAVSIGTGRTTWVAEKGANLPPFRKRTRPQRKGQHDPAYYEDDFLATSLQFGVLWWDRSDGIYWAAVRVSSREMDHDAEFEIIMTPDEPIGTSGLQFAPAANWSPRRHQ